MVSRRYVLPLFFAIAGLLTAASAGPIGAFEGKWKLDKKKTQAKGGPEDLECEIKAEGSSGILIKSKYREPKNSIYPLMWVGVMTYELPLSADGSEKTNQIGPFAHVSKTTVDGNKMTTDWRATMENGHVEGQWIRTVSPDGREMTLQIISKASDGRKMDQTLVFAKR
jgi:hypothetical protein